MLVEKATEDFSIYLCGNLDSVNAKKPISFTKELEHTQNFLSLEILLYKDNIDVDYDMVLGIARRIKTERFSIITTA